MNSYKIIFESGNEEIIRASAVERNNVLEKIIVKDENGEEVEELFLNPEHISAVIPQSVVE